VRDDLAERLHVRAVLANGVRALGQVGRARALQEDRVRVPLDAVRGQAGRGCHLLDRLARTDACLDLTRPHLALDLDLDLAEPGQVAARGGPEALVGRKQEALAAGRVLADDGLAVFIEPDDSQRSHPGLPCFSTSPSKDVKPASLLDDGDSPCPWGYFTRSCRMSV
jgi:hypothetical protein